MRALLVLVFLCLSLPVSAWEYVPGERLIQEHYWRYPAYPRYYGYGRPWRGRPVLGDPYYDAGPHYHSFYSSDGVWTSGWSW